jgi:hypothetical protein
MTTKLVINHVADKKAPLYHVYPQQMQPQGAYIELDCKTGQMIADWNGEIGNAIPFSVYHGHDRRWPVPNNMSADAINSLMDEIAPLAQRVLDGYDSTWDGNNMVAVLDDDAQEAEAAIVSLIPDEGDLVVWDVEEYLFGNCHLIEHWDTQSIEDAVAELEATVESGSVVLGDFEDALINHACEALDYRPASYLNRNHIKILWQRGEIDRERVKEWLREMK